MTSRHLGKLILLGLVVVAVFGYVIFRVWGGTLIDLTLTSNAALSNGLVGHWTFDGPQMVSNVADSSGQGNNGNFVSPITFRAAASAANSSYAATSVTVSKPTGTVEGDVMIAALGWDANGSITAPSGWTLIRSTLYDVDNNVAAWYKVAGASEPADYTWSQPGNDDFSVGIATYYNVNTGNPINIENAQTNTTSSNVVAPSITTTAANTMLVFIGSIDHNNVGNTWTPPSGMTERVDQTNTWTSIEIADVVQASAGSTGTKTAVTTDTRANVGHLIALNPVPSTTVPGRIGQALSFDGVDDHVEVPDSNSLDTGDIFTQALWFKRSSISGAVEVLFDKGAGSSSFAIDTDNSIMLCKDNFGCLVSTTISITDTGWHHAVVTKNGSTIKLYIDGVDYTGAVTNQTIVNTTSVFFISGPSGEFPFNGSIDDVRIYNRALSASEVSRLYNLGATTHINTTLNTNPNLTNGLVGHWSMDGSDVDIASTTAEIRDRSGQGNNGALQGQVATITETPLTSGSTTTNASSYLTASVSPTADRLILVAITHNTDGGAFSVSGVSGAGLTFTKINEVSIGSYTYVSLWRALSASPSSGQITIDFGANTAWNIAWSVKEFAGVDTSGTNGAGAVVQSATNTAASTNAITATLAAFGSTDNATYGCTGTKTESSSTAITATPGSGFTEIHDLYVVDSTFNFVNSVHSEWRAGNDTTVDMSFSRTAGFLGAIAVEIKAATNATTVPGRIGQALSFDGVDDYVNVGSGASLTVDDNVTIAAWIKPSAASDSAYERIITTSDSYSPDGYGLAYIPSEDKVVGGFGSALPENQVTYKSTVTAPENTWSHVAMTASGSGGSTVKIYVNGVEVTNGTEDVNSVTFDAGSGVFLGIRHSLSASHAFNGSIDDARIYNRALSADEISRLYNLGATTHIGVTLNTNPDLVNGLVGHWTFDGAKMFSNIGDSSGAGRNGNLSGQAATTTIIGRVGQALYFDGVNDFVKVPSSTAFDFASTGGFSYFTWFKKDTACSSPEGTTEVFANRFGSDHAVRTWWFGCATNGSTLSTLSIDIFQSASGPEAYLQTESSINDGAWHHGGWVYDGSANEARLYLDGVLQDSTATTFTGSFNVANPICIGSYGTNCNGKLDGGGAYEADGSFDDVRAYNRALSASEIQRLYQLGR